MRIFFPEANTHLVCVPESSSEDSDDSNNINWELACEDSEQNADHWFIKRYHDEEDSFRLWWDTKTEQGCVDPFRDGL